MKKHYFSLIYLALAAFFLNGCNKDGDGLPKVETIGIITYGDNYALIEGRVVSRGNSPLLSRGVCWGTSPSPKESIGELYDSLTNYSINLYMLKEQTKYYIRAYAENKEGISYGKDIVFTTTAECPDVLTLKATDISLTEATLPGESNDNDFLEHGIVWGTNDQLFINKNKITCNSATTNFNTKLTGLNPNTIYYYRAYTTNSTGTGYGATYRFCTDVKDVDQNVYDVEVINDVCWMVQNLKTKHFQNGENITLVKDFQEWLGLNSSAYSNYYNDEVNSQEYGRLYNWYAATDSRNICPAGWHIPDKNEFKILITKNRAKDLKENGIAHWDSPNQNSTNYFGFTALPGGLRGKTFYNMGSAGYWWSSEKIDPQFLYIDKNDSCAVKVIDGKDIDRTTGFSIRCVRDKSY